MNKKRIILIVLLSMFIVVISSVCCFADSISIEVRPSAFTQSGVLYYRPLGASSYQSINFPPSSSPFNIILDSDVIYDCYCVIGGSSYRTLGYRLLDGNYGVFSRVSSSPTILDFSNIKYFLIDVTSPDSNVRFYFTLDLPIQILPTPSNFRWTAGNILNWDHVLPQALYEVQFSTDAIDWVAFDTVNANRVECFIEGYYRVRALPVGASEEGYEASEWSSTVRYNPGSAPLLVAPVLTYNNYQLSFVVPDSLDPTLLSWAIYKDNQLIKTLDAAIGGTYNVYQNGTYYVTYSNSGQLSYPSNQIVVSDYGNVLPPDNPTPPSGGGSGEDPDVIDWIRYFIDKIDYFFDTILYGIKTIIGGAVQAISTFVEYITDFVSAVGDLFSFLPDEIVGLITSCIFIVALVGILRVFL